MKQGSFLIVKHKEEMTIYINKIPNIKIISPDSTLHSSEATGNYPELVRVRAQVLRYLSTMQPLS